MTRRCALPLIVATAVLASCGTAQHTTAPSAPPQAPSGFHSGDCNLVTDDEINAVAGLGMFTKVVVSNVGCFWQEKDMYGSVGAGMGITTWWYRGSALDSERKLEGSVGRQLVDLSLNGNSGFEASDPNTCSVYVAKGADVITWSIQTLNPVALPSLCPIIRGLAQLSQDRVN
jgi:hypothetical protein